MVDLLSRGRVSVVLGAGYRVAEFEMAGVDRTQRGKLMDECKLSEYDAFRFIQTNAMRLRLTMKDVALQVIAKTLWPGQDSGQAGGGPAPTEPTS